MKVGFIGLGHMGAGMATNLVKAGHEVTVYNRTRKKEEALVRLGAHPAMRIAEVCQAEAVITMLSDDGALESAAFGNDGIVANLKEHAIHISMSTISVALSEKLAGAHAKASQRYIAAPVFGRPDAATAAKLFIVAGGEANDIQKAQPLFDAMGQKTFNIGNNPANANLVKLSGNFLIASVIETLGEAFALVSKAGIDRHQYLDILTNSLFTAPVYKNYGALIADQKFEPAGFAAPLGLKDIRLALAAAENLRVPLPVASLLRDRFLSLLAQGGDKLDWSALGSLAAKDAGEA